MGRYKVKTRFYLRKIKNVYPESNLKVNGDGFSYYPLNEKLTAFYKFNSTNSLQITNFNVKWNFMHV